MCGLTPLYLLGKSEKIISSREFNQMPQSRYGTANKLCGNNCATRVYALNVAVFYLALQCQQSACVALQQLVS